VAPWRRNPSAFVGTLTGPMRAIAIINQKGGVGKTTTAVNLGAAMAYLGRRVLLVDLDPQCNLTVHVDQDPEGDGPTIYELLRGDATLERIVRPTRDPNLFVAPASVDLAGIELELASEVGRETILAEAIEAYERAGHAAFDFVLIDCPPSLGLLAINALVASGEVFVPVQAEFFSLQGVGKILEITELVQRRLNPRLHITAVIACRYDGNMKLSQAVLEELQQHFGDTVLRTRVRRNVKLAEAPSHGRTIFSYDRGSRGAHDYLALACEVLGIDAVPALEPLPSEVPATPDEVGADEAAPGEAPAATDEAGDEAGDGPVGEDAPRPPTGDDVPAPPGAAHPRPEPERPQPETAEPEGDAERREPSALERETGAERREPEQGGREGGDARREPDEARAAEERREPDAAAPRDGEAAPPPDAPARDPTPAPGDAPTERERAAEG